MSRAEKVTLGALAIIACGLMLAVLRAASVTYEIWRGQPLGPGLAYPTGSPPAATSTFLPAVNRTTTAVMSTTASLSTDTPASPFLACGDLPPMVLLGIGVDVRSADYRHGRADVIRAVRVDFRKQRVTVLEFPRDLWVKIPGIERSLNTDHQKLNTAYAYGGPEYGPGLLARTLDLNFGLKTDHYVAVNMNVFVDVVDALGGLDITIPQGGVDGRTSTDRSARLVFPEGPQHLSGEQALTLARIRNESVFQRAGNQNMVMCALRKEMEGPATLLRLPELIDSFTGNILTDLTPEQVSQLACLGTQMPRRNIVFAAFPLELFEVAEVRDPVLKGDVFIWEADFSTLRGYTEKFQAGEWPAPSEPGAGEAEISRCE